MQFITRLRKSIPEDHLLRIWWHRLESFVGALLYGFPSRKLRVIGVTGTDGKTTTCQMIAHIFQVGRKKVGLTSTTHFQVGTARWSNTTHQTTLGRFHLHKLMRRMVREGCGVAILETSSHALHQGRLTGIDIDAACITNVTLEHLEYHHTFEQYVQAKALLFKRLATTKRKRGVPKTAVVNLDSNHWPTFVQAARSQGVRKVDEVYGYTTFLDKKAQNLTEVVWASDIHITSQGSTFRLHIQNTSVEVRLPLLGLFNVYNALAASSVCHSQGIALEVIAHALQSFHPVEGRMEQIDEGQAFTVYVDFAVTPAALENVYKSLRAVTTGRVIGVFGATGERDPAKRPIMGELAVTLTDLAVITDDEPYSEDPAALRKEIMHRFGFLKKERGKDFVEVADRRDAIKYALQNAKKGDAVVITGMGSFLYRMVNGQQVPWDERQIVRDILKELENGS